MLYITGDCHADWSKFSTKAFPEQKEMTREDFVLVCGDFGIWHNTKSERWWLDWLEDKNFTICFVDGNHENFDRLYSDEFEVVDFHGGKAHKIRENVYHLMRGYIFDICDKKIFAFGGARSHDIRDGILNPADFSTKKEYKIQLKKWARAHKIFRVNTISWWKEEMPNHDEMIFGLKTLAQHNNKVDYVITHCCPQSVAAIFSMGCYKPDNLTKYFDVVKKTISFDKWFFWTLSR